MKGCATKKNKNPRAWFGKNFADGQEGRPDGIEDFAKAFQTYMSGFYWKTPKPWRSLYTQKVPSTVDSGYVYDEPTWTWSRVRTEPYFGQGQAKVAGELLLDLGRRREAIQAFVWALAADGPSPEVERPLLGALQAEHLRDAAWVVEHRLRFPHTPTSKPAPFLRSLYEVQALLRRLEEAASVCEAGQLHMAAAVILADRNRLAAWLGKPVMAGGSVAGQFLNHPFDRHACHLGRGGWEDGELTGYEEHFAKGLWYVAANEDLHVGRKKPRTATGRLDRSAHLHHAFALSAPRLMPGAYRIKMRIKFTTSYVSGAVVFGYARRDLNLRFGFSAGDLMYAIGESEEKPAFDEMRWSLNGLRQRDGALPGSLGGGGFAFERALPSFDLELLVEGPTVQAFINSKKVGTYHTVDGAPIEGRVGFAVGYGAYQVQKPTVQRLDRSRLAGHPKLSPLGLDLSLNTSKPFPELTNLPLKGIPPSPNGTLLVWIPMPWLSENEPFDPDHVLSQARLASEKMTKISERTDCSQQWIIAIPEAVGEERIRPLENEILAMGDRAPALVTHKFPPSIGTPDPTSSDGNQRWILFVDSAGVIRQVVPLVNIILSEEFEGTLLHWIDVFKDHGRPDRDLPEYSREMDMGEDEIPGGDEDSSKDG
jgi:hypothetical protein